MSSPPVGSTVQTVPAQRLTQYNVERKFLKGSKLHIFLAVKEPDIIQATQCEYTLFVVLSALRHVISREKLYDPNNTTVIIASSDLEHALDMKFMHVTEIRDVVLTQMELLDPSVATPAPSVSVSQPQANQQTQGQLANTGNKSKFDINGRYWVKPLLLKVFREVAGVEPTQVIFSYRECTSHLSQYILDKKDSFFDNRNIKIAHVEGDLLGEAFNVKVFHRTQVSTLLRNQLIPLGENIVINKKVFRPSPDNDRTLVVRAEMVYSSEKLTTTLANINATGLKRSHNEAGLGHIQVPEAGPSLAKVSPSTSGQVDNQETGRLLKFEPTSVGIPVQRSAGSDQNVDVAATNSVGSADEREPNIEDVDDEVEYEPDSSGDEEDVPHSTRHRNSSGESNFNDGAIDVITNKDEVDYSETFVEAESSDESESEQTSISWGPQHQLQRERRCLKCPDFTNHFFRYCDDCYKDRRRSLPDRPVAWRKRECVYRGAECPAKKGEKCPCGPAPNSECIYHGAECHAKKGKKCQGGPMPKDPRIDSSQQNGDQDKQSHNQMLSTGIRTEDLLPPTHDTELMQPGPSGIQNLIPGPSGMRPLDQELLRRLRWTTGGDHPPPGSSGWTTGGDQPPPGGSGLTIKSFIAVPEMTCVLCCLKPKDACLIHGNVSHQVCCYKCAKKLFRKKDSRCPICRRKIEKITRNIIP